MRRLTFSVSVALCFDPAFANPSLPRLQMITFTMFPEPHDPDRCSIDGLHHLDVACKCRSFLELLCGWLIRPPRSLSLQAKKLRKTLDTRFSYVHVLPYWSAPSSLSFVAIDFVMILPLCLRRSRAASSSAANCQLGSFASTTTILSPDRLALPVTQRPNMHLAFHVVARFPL